MEIKIEHYQVNADCMKMFSGNILAPFRRNLIKFYHRLVRMSERYGLTVDEMYSIFIHYWVSMDSKNFWQLWINNGNIFNPNWREDIIEEIKANRGK